MDTGHFEFPETVKLPSFPSNIITHVQRALSCVLEPTFDTRDDIFQATHPIPGSSSDEFCDRETRAIFVCLMAVLVGEYQKFVTVLRFQPAPAFFFNLVRFCFFFAQCPVVVLLLLLLFCCLVVLLLMFLLLCFFSLSLSPPLSLSLSLGGLSGHQGGRK